MSEPDDYELDAADWVTDTRDEDDDDYSEPIGSCEQCGVNLYQEDDLEYCDQCLWRLKGGM